MAEGYSKLDLNGKSGIVVSIIIPCYNSGKYLMDSVKSIVNQTYVNWELLIVDDCSTDSITKNELENLRHMDDRIRILSTQENSGAGAARNVGIENSKGVFIPRCFRRDHDRDK